MKKIIKLYDKDGNELVPDNINKLGGTVLWTNPDTSINFDAQNIAINNLSNYNACEILYLYSVGMPYILSTGIIPLNQEGTVLSMIYNANSNNFYTSRFVKFIENGFGLYNANDSSNQTANGRCVPLYIIGYKKSIFE